MKRADLLRQVSVAVSAEAEEAVLELLGQIFRYPASFYSNAETGAQIASVYLEDKSDWNTDKERELASGLERLKDSGWVTAQGPTPSKRSAKKIGPDS